MGYLVRMIVLCGTLASAGCASQFPPKVDSLALADTKDEIVLTEKVSIVNYNYDKRFRWEYAALPGTYTAQRKNDNGTYYFGSGRSIAEIATLYGNVPNVKVGGIYLPNNPSAAPEFFYLFEPEKHTVADLDAYIQERGVKASPTTTKTASPDLAPAVIAPHIANTSVATAGLGAAAGGAVVSGILELSRGQVTPVRSSSDPELAMKIRAAYRAVSTDKVPPPESARKPDASSPTTI